MTPRLLAQAGLDRPLDRAVRQTLVLAARAAGLPAPPLDPRGRLRPHARARSARRCRSSPRPCRAARSSSGTRTTSTSWASSRSTCSALGMLTALSASCASRRIALHQALPSSTPWPEPLAAIPAEDPAVYEMICEADTIGVFQIESRAQMSHAAAPQAAALLRPRHRGRHRPARADPGRHGAPLPAPAGRAGAGRYPYARARADPERTLGVPLFQEQVMRMAMVGGGLHAGRGRRAPARHDRTSAPTSGSAATKTRSSTGHGASGASRERTPRQSSSRSTGFAGYGFPESHAASFALLVYASAWLKRYHPAAFACALLNCAADGLLRAAHARGGRQAPRGGGAGGRRRARSRVGGDARGRHASRAQPAAPGERPALRVGLHASAGCRARWETRWWPPARERPFDVDRRPGWRARGSPRRGWSGWRRRARCAASRCSAGARCGARSRLDRRPGGGDLPGAATSMSRLRPSPLHRRGGGRGRLRHHGLSERAHPMALLRPTLAARRVRTARELGRLRDRMRSRWQGSSSSASGRRPRPGSSS